MKAYRMVQTWFLILTMVQFLPAQADDSSNIPSPAVVSALGTNANALTGQPLNVVLKDMGDTLGHMMRALGDMKREVSRQETLTMVDPDFDSPYFYDWNSAWDLTYPIPDDPIYTRNTGRLLPARPQLLKRFMAEVDSWLSLLQAEVNAVAASPQPSWQPQMEVLTDTMQNISRHCQELQVMTQMQDADNQGIARKDILIRDSLAGINDMRKDLLKRLKQS